MRVPLELTVLTLCAGAAGVLGDDEVTFHVQPAVTTSRTYELLTTTAVEEATLLLGDMGEHHPGEGSETTTTLTYEVEESCLAAADGRPTRLRRRFGGLRRESEFEAPEQEEGVHIEGGPARESELADRVVLFERDPESGEWSARYDEDAEAEPGEAGWLEGLRYDMDFLRFLPDRPVAVGDSWTVDASALEDLLEPGGRVMVFPPPSAQVPAGGIVIAFGDESDVGDRPTYEGDIDVELTAVREADGELLGVLRVEVDAQGESDSVSAFEEQAAKRGQDVDYSLARIERAVEGQGTIVWNLTRGCLASAEFEGQLETASEMEWTQDMGGVVLDLSFQQTSSGTVSLAVEVE